MYLPSHFEETRREVLDAFLRSHPLGLLVTQGAAGLEANALPFLFDAERGPHGTLRAHGARANPVWREASCEVDSMVVFQGPQAYVSPNWYATKAETGKVVPTWNYVIVQARGRLVVHDDVQWVRGLVGELTARHEAAMPSPWKVEDAPAEFTDSLLRAIVGLESPTYVFFRAFLRSSLKLCRASASSTECDSVIFWSRLAISARR